MYKSAECCPYAGFSLYIVWHTVPYLGDILLAFYMTLNTNFTFQTLFILLNYVHKKNYTQTLGVAFPTLLALGFVIVNCIVLHVYYSAGPAVMQSSQRSSPGSSRAFTLSLASTFLFTFTCLGLVWWWHIERPGWKYLAIPFSPPPSRHTCKVNNTPAGHL